MSGTLPFIFNHEHLLIDAELQYKLNYLQRHSIVISLIEKLLQELNMKKLAPLEIIDATDFRLPGWSFIQPITTSHISGHYFEEEYALSHLHMDVYSCKKYEWKKIFPILDDVLKLDQWSANLVMRSVNTAKQTHKLISGKGASIVKILKIGL